MEVKNHTKWWMFLLYILVTFSIIFVYRRFFFSFYYWVREIAFSPLFNFLSANVNINEKFTDHTRADMTKCSIFSMYLIQSAIHIDSCIRPQQRFIIYFVTYSFWCCYFCMLTICAYVYTVLYSIWYIYMNNMTTESIVE